VVTRERIVKAGAERVDDLEPLWKALVDHHRSVDPRLPGIPIRTPDDAWTYRRAEYVRWLAEPDAFALIAEREGNPSGYAVVSFHEPADDHWVTRERFAELQSLAVLPHLRGAGLGQRLMDRVFGELRELGIREMVIGVLVTNEPAIRFYERLGFRPWVTKYLGTIPNRPQDG
jgi:ribosomal protein S18 acetylase RimI-like enzyme